MRAIVLTFFILASLPIILVKPFYGVLVWSWISYFNPHRYVWGFATEIRFALLVGGLTIVAYFFSKEPKRLPPSTLTVLLFLFLAWLAIADLFALHPEEGVGDLNQATKIILFNGFLTMAMLTSRERIDWLVWVIVASIGFFGFKGGAFTILTGGAYRVWGPPQTFMEDNNGLALALLMVIPMIRYLQLSAANRWVRLSLGLGILLCIASVFGSHSRGALVAMVLMFPFFWWNSRHKVLTGFLAVFALGIGLAFMPDHWVERMQTIKTYQQDGSANARLRSWGYAIDLANDRPITGGGFGAFKNNLTDTALREHGDNYWNAHSIYFQVLGEQGYVGLLIFLALLIGSFLKAGQIARRTRGDPDLKWAHDLSSMLQVSVVAYAIAGAFQNLQFFDLVYHVFALIIATSAIVKQSQGSGAKAKFGPADLLQEPQAAAGVVPAATTAAPRRPVDA